VMRAAGDDPDGTRLRGPDVVLARAGLRIREALALAESDLDAGRGAILVRMARAPNAGRSGWTAGPAGNSRRGSHCAASSRLVPCSASCAVRPADGRGARPASVPNCMTKPLLPGCDDGSRPFSCATRTPVRCRARASRCWSSSASSDIMRVILSGAEAVGRLLSAAGDAVVALRARAGVSARLRGRCRRRAASQLLKRVTNRRVRSIRRRACQRRAS